ncbi:MAG: AAA family ATPase [Firmicutes bacterium]|nr:AAA family ATPase [Bacillota bacterium]
MDLFEQAREEREKREAPLAARMRPRTLDEMVGQGHILGPGTLLRRAIESDRLFSSIILWGPPGTGKTTLAMIVARTTRSHFETLSAVLAGVADVRRVVAEAKERRALYGQRTILLVDEVHRWNKAQQDALLPHVEDGTVVLIGATTENPYFEVVPPLLSRSRVFRLRPLSPAEIMLILRRALSDPERGYGGRPLDVSEEALEHLARVADGDARAALNALELAVESTPPGADGVIRVDLGVAQESIQQRALRYYKGADEHYDTISAFIKSVRGSDPHAALYWLAKMVHAGEDPRFIMRRLLILAAEDIGLADPMGIVVAAACARALEWVGMPEAQYHLAQATIYLATAPKSNSVGGYFAALAKVQEQGELEVPDHLKDASRDGAALGHGKGYLYPHDFPGHFVPQQYLPPGLGGATFYRPGDQGFEREIARRLAEWEAARARQRATSSSQNTVPESPPGVPGGP